MNSSLDARLLSLPMLPLDPICSIVVPCLNEEGFVRAVLEQATAQRYPEKRLEILVVDGGSTDRTRDIVLEMRAHDPRIELLDNPERVQSAGMNVGVRRARGDVIVRMDAHAEYAPDYVARSVEVLRATGAANAGGAARAKFRNGFQRAVCAALMSPLGVGGSAYRDASKEGFVESVFNGAFRREAFEVAGLYDSGARTNEDAELNQRIVEAGGRVYLARSIVAFYYPRSSFGALVQQYFRYGEGRARTLLRRRGLLSARPLVPFATVTGFASLGLLAFVTNAVHAPLVLLAVLYGALVVAESVRVALRHDLGALPRLLAIFPVMHAAHGLGVWKGFAGAAVSGIQDDAPERLAPR